MINFWNKVNKNSGIFGDDSKYPTECWVWIGARTKLGYGRIKIDNKEYRAHRISWQIHYGTIPIKKQVLHKCDYRACINPYHLFVGTHIDNMHDKKIKGRALRGEQNPNAKLSTNDVNNIRKLYQQNLSISEIARQFSIGRTAIRSIIYGRTWYHNT